LTRRRARTRDGTLRPAQPAAPRQPRAARRRPGLPALPRHRALRRHYPAVGVHVPRALVRDHPAALRPVALRRHRQHEVHAGRARMNSDLTLRAVYRPRALLISTGEQLPDGQSVLARLVTVEVRRPDIAMDSLNRAQAERAQYGSAMAGYIAWLAPQLDAL